VELAGEEEKRAEKLQEEESMDAEIVAPDDTGMSIDESDEEQTSSDGFSGSSDCSSESESVVSQGSRKRTAEESPEREPAETIRKSFPGTVTRSEAGCRIYVPSALPKKDAKEKGLSVEVVEALGAKVVEASGAKVVEASGAKVVETTGVGSVETTVMVGIGAKDVGNDKLNGSKDTQLSLQKSTIVGVATQATVAMRCDSPSVPVCLIEAMTSEIGYETEATRNISAAESSHSMASSGDDTIRSGSVVPATGTETCRMTVARADLETSDRTPGTTGRMGEASLSAVSAVSSLTGRNAMLPRDEVTTFSAAVSAPTVPGRHTVVDGWAREARMVEVIFQIMEGMEPPWVTLNVLEIAVNRYPDVSPETLRLIIMTVMMSQRRCVTRLTRAGLRLGPRTDRDGNAFVELDLDFADRYSISH